MSNRLQIDDLKAIALRILRSGPDPVIRVRLLRSVLHASPDDPRLIQAIEEREASPHVQALVQEQAGDGGWRRLHSADAKTVSRIPTTEWAVERAVALGLDRNHPVLQNARGYLESVLSGTLAPEDPAEKNDRWPTGVRLFAAATLARFDPENAVLDPVWDLWHEIASQTFADGIYDPDAEAAAHGRLTRASVKDSYLVLANRYALALLGSRIDRVEPALRDAIVRWLWRRPEGIGYLSMPLPPPGLCPTPSQIDRWFRSHELLARFRSPMISTGPILEWLDRYRTDAGGWDLGARLPGGPVLPFSANWRAKGVREIDWTTRVLGLLTLVLQG